MHVAYRRYLVDGGLFVVGVGGRVSFISRWGCLDGGVCASLPVPFVGCSGTSERVA